LARDDAGSVVQRSVVRRSQFVISRIPSPAAQHQRVRAQRCLIVDDEVPLRQALARLMRNEGFLCEEAGSGAEALEIMERAEPALVFTDLQMPHMDGIELLNRIRARFPDVAVVMITGVADINVALDCLALGAMDYLTKPFRLEEMQSRALKAIEKRQLIIENREYQLRLEERVKEQAGQIEQIFFASVQALAHALELKDPYTRGHSARVAQTSTAAARLMGLDENVIRQIDLGANLHDIGKIGVREAVLHKTDPLTEEEYEHIMTHPVVGWRILSPLLRESPIALGVIRSHHERIDGRGVPDGLRGAAIPIAARIVAVTDAFDAMMSGRPYRTPLLSLDQCVTELRAHSGTQFDRDVVDVFVDAIRKDIVVPPNTQYEALAATL
jgi:response regulator RpfG family c-di-GMP phosphodiesterase